LRGAVRGRPRCHPETGPAGPSHRMSRATSYELRVGRACRLGRASNYKLCAAPNIDPLYTAPSPLRGATGGRRAARRPHPRANARARACLRAPRSTLLLFLPPFGRPECVSRRASPAAEQPGEAFTGCGSASRQRCRVARAPPRCGSAGCTSPGAPSGMGPPS